MSFLIEQGQTLVCLGDSITQASDGYVSVMAALIGAKYPERAIRILNAGIGGHKAPALLARLDRDVLAHRPDWVTVNVGINDVWHGLNGPGGVPLDVYEPTLDTIVAQLQSAKARVVLVTPTVIGENPDDPANRTLGQYVAAMQRVADMRRTLLVPTHADFLMTLRAGQAADPNFRLTTDGVHMNPIGNARMALSILSILHF
ncbi:MAG: SGNH/GDSL hydrolase family protein [Armatimonadota bacterium]|nr:SGNH/GDSL hydrolase family protein [Armatimonadota bacterium]